METNGKISILYFQRFVADILWKTFLKKKALTKSWDSFKLHIGRCDLRDLEHR
jgi:hypothetical protein